MEEKKTKEIVEILNDLPSDIIIKFRGLGETDEEDCKYKYYNLIVKKENKIGDGVLWIVSYYDMACWINDNIQTPTLHYESDKDLYTALRNMWHWYCEHYYNDSIKSMEHDIEFI